MNGVFFVSGIDTGIGKTVATGMMARFLRRRGDNAVTVKMVQTGNDGRSEDLEFHRRLMGCGELPGDAEKLTAPQIFHFPASPHLAAKLENRAVDTRKIAEAVQTLAAQYDIVLVEGAGGLAVPLTDRLLTVDFAAGCRWPCILVGSTRLGSLNHTLLSAEALRARKIRLAGIVLNWSPNADPTIAADTREVLRKRLGAPLVELPQIDPEHPDEIDFSPIFGAEK